LGGAASLASRDGERNPAMSRTVAKAWDFAVAAV
jgi:hypothetical protein